MPRHIRRLSGDVTFHIPAVVIVDGPSRAREENYRPSSSPKFNDGTILRGVRTKKVLNFLRVCHQLNPMCDQSKWRNVVKILFSGWTTVRVFFSADIVLDNGLKRLELGAHRTTLSTHRLAEFEVSVAIGATDLVNGTDPRNVKHSHVPAQVGQKCQTTSWWYFSFHRPHAPGQNILKGREFQNPPLDNERWTKLQRSLQPFRFCSSFCLHGLRFCLHFRHRHHSNFGWKCSREEGLFGLCQPS